MRLLLVEDDAMLGRGILGGLKREGYSVDWMSAGESALHCLSEEHYQLLILDLSLPDMDGTQVLKCLRQAGNTVPVLILTARDSISDRVGGLDLGADDYLTKPFEYEELMARIRALLRRRSGRADFIIRHGDIVLHSDKSTVFYQGNQIPLSKREYILLLELLANAGRVLTRDQLETSVYEPNQEVASNAIEVHIHHLRKKFYNDLIRTVRGVGYLVEMP